MARSIHETHRALQRAKRWDDASDERHEDDLRIVRTRLAKKRRYKARAGRGEVSQVLAMDWVVEVLAVESHPSVHHSLTVDDIHGLLERFPADVRPSLSRVILRSGWHEDDMTAEGAESDPFTGRPGFEIRGGIWMPALLGRYRFSPMEIDLFGFAYEPSALRVPEIQTVLLWFRQALTFAHEVAHCWDHTARTSGDRWALDETNRGERYAEDAARVWLVDRAVPYFREQHRERADMFDAWIADHIGVSLSLERVAEDADRSLWGAVVGLFDICAQWGDVDEPDLRVAMAEELHFVDDFETAREVLGTVLASAPDHRDATLLMGNIAVHERDWAQALAWTATAIALSPDSRDAYQDRIDALVGAGQWANAVDACGTALAIDGDQRSSHRLMLKRAFCFMELGEFVAAENDIDEVLAGGRPWETKAARALRADGLVRQARWEEARDLAARALAERQPLLPRALLTAAGWEARRQLGEEVPAPAPTARHLEVLRWNGRDAWADRLLSLGLRPEQDRQTRRAVELNTPTGPLMRL